MDFVTVMVEVACQSLEVRPAMASRYHSRRAVVRAERNERNDRRRNCFGPIVEFWHRVSVKLLAAVTRLRAAVGRLEELKAGPNTAGNDIEKCAVAE